MFIKIIYTIAYLAYVSAQHHGASSYSSSNLHSGGGAHQHSHQASPVLTYQAAPALIKAPVAAYHATPAPVATYHAAPAVVKAPVATYHAAPAVIKTPVAAYHSPPVLVKAPIAAAPVAYHAAPAHHEEYPDAHPKYVYEYGVKDEKTHDIHNQHEERDGHVVKGFYSLVQPDGITRTVHYTADKGGFNAQVEYSGHANHPQQVQKAVVSKVAVAAPVHYQHSPVQVHHAYPHH